MTVQQEHPTAAAPITAPVQLPLQRQADHDARPVPARAPGAALAQGWGSVEDRTMCRLLMVQMTALSLFAVLLVWLGTRVWG